MLFAKINENCCGFLCKAKGILRLKVMSHLVKNPETKGVFAKINEKLFVFCAKLVEFCDLSEHDAFSKIQIQKVLFAKINEKCFNFLRKARRVLRFKVMSHLVKNPDTRGAFRENK